MNLSKGIKMFSDLLEKISRIIGGVSVAVFVVIISLQVVGRNILKVPMVWANDLSVVFFVWAVFFGSAIAVRYRKHYVLEFLPEKFAKTNCSVHHYGTRETFSVHEYSTGLLFRLHSSFRMFYDVVYDFEFSGRLPTYGKSFRKEGGNTWITTC